MLHWLWYTLPLVSAPGLERLLGGPPPPVVPLPAASRVLAVGAHPDDLEYSCGGTLSRFARAGTRVTALVATAGERGGDPVIRRREQQEAASLLGCSRLIVLGHADGGVRRDDPGLAADLRSVLAEEEPDLLLTFDPEHPYPVYRHLDHLAVAEAALRIWSGPSLLFHSRRPTMSVEITETFAAKAAAFAAHRSQMPARGAAGLARWHLARRSAHGRRRYAERFREAG